MAVSDLIQNLVLKVPSNIVENKELSLNERLILAFSYNMCELKLGYDQYTNVQLSQFLNIHYNIVGSCRKRLVSLGYLIKNGRKYKLTDKFDKHTAKDKRQLLLPYDILSLDITTGAKFLWAEINSYSNGGNAEYFAKRSFQADRFGVSEDSITNWTNVLIEHDLVNYDRIFGKYASQRIMSVKPRSIKSDKKKTIEKPKVDTNEQTNSDDENYICMQNGNRVYLSSLLPHKNYFEHIHEIMELFEDLDRIKKGEKRKLGKLLEMAKAKYKGFKFEQEILSEIKSYM